MCGVYAVSVACIVCESVQFYKYLEFQLSTFDMEFKFWNWEHNSMILNGASALYIFGSSQTFHDRFFSNFICTLSLKSIVCT